MATQYAEAIDVPEDDREEKRSPLDVLFRFLESDNIANDLDNDALGAIGARVVKEYEIDKSSRSEWEQNNKEAMDLALQIAEVKNYPWYKAANIKYPLLTTATIQFAARAYPAILGQGAPVKSKVVGRDEDGAKRARGERVARHMSWQLLEEMEEWEDGVDRLLHILPIAGMCYKKTYFDPILGRNRSELVTPDKCVVNDGATDLETVPRITQEIEFYPFEIEERFRSGVFRKVELGLSEGDDDDAPHMFLEQHRLYDLDEDGYQEPYICTVHKDTSQVVRIVPNFRTDGIAVNENDEIARIERDQYFTKFSFMPNPGGGFHDIGFGYLLRPINEAVNTTLNQMLDAGHLQNVGGGFIGAGARLRGGQVRFKMGQFQQVDVSGGTLRENLVPFDFKGPSVVLFQLLGLLIEAGKDISSVKDILTGDTPNGQNIQPTTVLAMIEQGMQVFSAIYKRIFRALKREYAKLYDLNSIYLDPETYFTVLDEAEQVGPEDYNTEDFDIVPVADPSTVTNMQRLARAEFLFQFKDDPHYNGLEIRKRMLEAASIDNIDELLVDELPPNPAVLLEADKMDIEKRKLALDEIELQFKAGKMEAETAKTIAEAEGVEPGQQIQAYLGLMRELNERAKLVLQEKQTEGRTNVQSGGVRSVEGSAGNG